MDQSFPQKENPFGSVAGFFSHILQMVRNYSSAKPLFFVFILLLIPVTLLAVQQTVSFMSKAQTAAGTVAVSFSPSEISMPPNQTVKIMLDSGTGQVAFARVVFSFDPNKIRLNGAITTYPNLTTIVERSNAATANSQGKVVIVIAASPTDTKPQGSFELASLTFSALSTSPEMTTMDFTTSDIQIVESGGTALTPNTVSLNVNLNNANTTGIINPSPTAITQATITLPAQPCNPISSQFCFEQWKREFTGALISKFADLNSDGNVNLVDFEIHRRAALP